MRREFDSHDAKIPPNIKTERLFLNSFSQSDAADLFLYASNENVCLYTSWLPHRSVDDSGNFISQTFQVQSWRQESLRIIWAIRKMIDMKAIGSFSVTKISRDEMQIDYALSFAEWGKGYMTEVIQGVRDWIFDNFSDVTTIKAKVMPENFRSISLLKKCGFIYLSDHFEHIEKFGSDQVKLSNFSLYRTEK